MFPYKKRWNFVGLGLFLFLSSCRTLVAPGPSSDIIHWLPPEADILIQLAIPGNEKLRDMLISYTGIDSTKLTPILKRLESFAIGLESEKIIPEEALLPFHMVAIGLWPRPGMIHTALGKAWKRTSKNPSRWKGTGTQELALVNHQEIFFSPSRIESMLQRREQSLSSLPQASSFDDEKRKALILQINKPSLLVSPSLFKQLGDENIEAFIRSIEIKLYRHTAENYRLQAKLYPKNPQRLESLALLLRLGLSARFALSPKPKERQIFSDMLIETREGSLVLLLPSLDLDVLVALLEESKVLSIGQP